jgi:HlyD family secretion protein
MTAFRRFPLPACLLLLAACSDEPIEVQRAPEVARAVSVARVESRALFGTTTASGLLIAREEAAVGVEQAGHRVLRVLVEEGTHVKAGQSLAILDDTVFRERLLQAQARAENAKAEADRVRGLDGLGVLSEEDIGNRRSQARIAHAQLREVQVQLGQMNVRAPVAGMVIERTVRPGSVSGGEPMFRIARGNEVDLDAEIPEAALLGMTVGQKVGVAIADGTTFEGTVRLISPRIDPDTKLGKVRVALPASPLLRVGGYGQATFAGRSQPTTVVPEKAVRFEASGPVVTLIGSDHRARRAPVRTGRRSDGMVELIQGPPVGSQVALAGGAFLLEGDLVTPEHAAAAKGK